MEEKLFMLQKSQSKIDCTSSMCVFSSIHLKIHIKNVHVYGARQRE